MTDDPAHIEKLDDAAHALLVVRCQLGEADALDELVARWHGRLWDFLRRLASDHTLAEDALQETWIGILRGLPALRDPERFVPWAFRIARTTVLSRLRRRYGEPSSVDVTDQQLEDTESLRDVIGDRLVVEQAVADLPLAERETVELFYLQELSVGDTADVLGVPAGTVKSRLHRARALLRRHLDTQEKSS